MKKTTMSSERQAPSFPNNISPCSIINLTELLKKGHNCEPYASKQKVETVEISYYGKEI